MKTNLPRQRRQMAEEVGRCYICNDPVCTKACKAGLDPGRLLRAVRMGNEAGAILRVRQMDACLECNEHSCEKVCLRKQADRSVSIVRVIQLLQGLSAVTKVTDSPSLPSLEINFCGIQCINPFILSSSPASHNYEMCARALEAGWAGICFKTISFCPTHEISPRFDQTEGGNASLIGFKNMEQLPEAPLRESFNTLYRLKQRYPDKLIISSIMGRTNEEWTRLAYYSTQAGADIIECNFSGQQLTLGGTSFDVGQNPDLVRQFIAATRRGTTLAILAKTVPNLGQMEVIIRAAREGGANGISAINTIKCIPRIDEKNFTSRPVINGMSSITGYSGKAIHPIALRFVHEIASYSSASNMSISGIGGIETWRDALDFLLLGSSNLQVCTAVMQYGFRIIDDLCEGLQLFMYENGYKNLSKLKGLALPNIIPLDMLEHSIVHQPFIDTEQCIGCGRCFTSCNDGGHQAIRFTTSRRPIIDKDKCAGCHLCTLVCPTSSIY